MKKSDGGHDDPNGRKEVAYAGDHRMPLSDISRKGSLAARPIEVYPHFSQTFIISEG
jgi:hypothetical protein